VLNEAKRISAGDAAEPATAQDEGGSGAATALTSLDIHKALKRVLPGDPGEQRLRPYLPAVTKQAWHLDKQSLKGVKRQRNAHAAEAPKDIDLPKD
jgi:hypothetical protein